MKHLLFLCTGNYYRSRLSAEYFNHIALQHPLKIKAFSRAIRQDLSKTKNKGCIAKEVIAILNGLHIPIHSQKRMPMSVTQKELISADYIIALDKTEHRPMIKKTFPSFAEQVQYLSVGDVEVEPIYVSAVKLIKQLDYLMPTL